MFDNRYHRSIKTIVMLPPILSVYHGNVVLSPVDPLIYHIRSHLYHFNYHLQLFIGVRRRNRGGEEV